MTQEKKSIPYDGRDSCIWVEVKITGTFSKVWPFKNARQHCEISAISHHRFGLRVVVDLGSVGPLYKYVQFMCLPPPAASTYRLGTSKLAITITLK